MITEPTLEHYVYYLRQIEGDDRKTIQKRRDAFAREVNALLAHLEGLSAQAVPAWDWPEEPEERGISQRIVRTDWLDNPQTGRSYFLESRAYGDVYWLQVGYYQQGETQSRIFASLRDEMWQPTDSEHLLGSSVYLCGIAAGDEAQLAPQLLRAYTGDKINDLASTRITKRRAEFSGSPRLPYLTALLYTTPQCEEWVGRRILNDIAVRLELYKHKADRQLAWCEANYPILRRQEQQVRETLDQIDPASSTDWDHLHDFVQLYQVFSGNAGLMAERQTSIAVNLNNLDIVLQELSLKRDRFLSAVRDRLQGRQRQLRADLAFADHTRARAAAVVDALKVRLALEQRLDLETKQVPRDVIEPSNWPGASFRGEESQTVTYPQVHAPPHIPLDAVETSIVQHVYRGFDQVLIENELGGGYSGTRVLMARLITPEGMPAAQRVIKLGPAFELGGERDRYTQSVGDFMPFSAARVEQERYCERDGRAGLSYIFVGGGGLGQAQGLEKYYHQAVSADTVEAITRTLDNLLDQELGQRWYGNTTPLYCFFAAEYGQHLVEHLRLKLRPASSDALWLVAQPPAPLPDYRRLTEGDIPREHEAIEPGALIVVEEMVVRKIKHGVVKLEDTGGQGTVVRIALTPESDVPQWLDIGARVGVRGEVIYNRRDRLEQIVCAAFPELASAIGSSSIALSGVSGTYPNPLAVYPQVMGRLLESRRSYVHGDLHLRNVLVDEWGKGWLIDFARVEKRHNLFDFIKLETYVRLMGLADHTLTFSLDAYARFEQALNDATLGRDGKCPDHPDLRAAYHVIRAVRRIARKYMGHEPDFEREYLPALFLYSLAMLKYFQPDAPDPTRLIFITGLLLGSVIAPDKPASWQPPKGAGEISAPQPSLGTGNRWAVLVGVDEYENEINYGRLHVCGEDVEAIRQQLIAGDFYPLRIRQLTDHAPELPTRANILATLQAVADATEPNDLLLFYYSGHGEERGGEPYLVPRDGQRLVLDDTAVSISRIKQIVEKAPARAKVIILDACHVGADIGKAAGPMSAEFIRRVFEEAEGMAILASCQQGQLSYEWRENQRSVFTHYLLEALIGKADRDEKGFVTVQDVSRHVTDGVKLWASQKKVSQTPTLQYTAAGDIMLVRYS